VNVRDAVVRHIRHRQAMMDHARGVELQEHGPRLPVSQLGHCPGCFSIPRARVAYPWRSREYSAPDMSPTNWGRSGWPNSCRMACASPRWNQ